MAFQLAEYPAQAQSLVAAGQHLLDSLDDQGIDQEIATVDLETASASRLPANRRLGFEAAPGAAEAAGLAKLEDQLGAAMLDLQSANVLLSAGAALQDQAGGGRTWLKTALADVAASKTTINQAFTARLEFAAPAKPSSTLDEAVTTFKDSADQALTAISDGTVSVIESAVTQLKKMDAAKVLEAIHTLGKSFEVGVASGRLISKGLDKLKSVLDSLSGLFGSEAFAAIKAKVEEMWKKIAAGDYTRTAVRWALQIGDVEQKVSAVAASKTATIPALDGASTALATLDDGYQRLLKVLNGIVSALVVALGVLAFLHFAGPWLALGGAAAYVCVLAAAVIGGMTYAGTLRVGPVHGVGMLIESANF